MLEILTFDDSKSALISLDQLDRTLKLEDGAGKLPKSAPIDHAHLIKKLIDMAAVYLPNNKAVVGPITIKQNNCKRIMWKGNSDECPLEQYLIERMVAKIGFAGTKSFEGEEDSEGSMALGISYNEKGIQVAFGHNVKVCQNLNVFGENFFSTYGNDAVPFEKGMELVKGWMQNLNPIMYENQRIINELKKVQVDEDTRHRVIGKIYEMAVLFNEGEKNAAPLNITECNKMVAKAFGHLKESDVITAWDMTNWATHILKPESSDMMSIMEKNARLNNFILKEFNIPTEFTDIVPNEE